MEAIYEDMNETDKYGMNNSAFRENVEILDKTKARMIM